MISCKLKHLSYISSNSLLQQNFVFKVFILKGIVWKIWQNRANQIKLPFLKIVQGTHSKPEFPLPKYPHSQSLAPLPPLVSSVGGRQSHVFGHFSLQFSPTLSIFSSKKKVIVFYVSFLVQLQEQFSILGWNRIGGAFKNEGLENEVFECSPILFQPSIKNCSCSWTRNETQKTTTFFFTRKN